MLSSFSSADLRRLAASADLLLAPPGEHPSPTWERDVCRSLGDLVGVDAVSFLVPTAGRLEIRATTHDAIAVESYLTHFAAIDRVAHRIAERRMTVAHPGRLPAHLRQPTAEFEHDFLRRFRLSNMLLLHQYAGAIPQAMVYFSTQGRTTPEGMERRAQLFDAIAPAFGAAISARQQHRQQGPLRGAIDLLQQPLAVHSGSGALLHRNPALRQLLAAEPARTRLEAVMQQLARAVVHRPRGRAIRSVERSFVSSRAEYRVCAGVQALEAGLPEQVLISLERIELHPGESPQARFQLTPREMQLAGLAAEGMTNKAIAERLGLSRYTVRNHLERIFAKVGIQRRGELARSFLGTG